MSAAAPRVVFFGPPNAGKTALLSAFLRVARPAAVPLVPAEAGPRDVVPHVVHAADDPGVVLIDTDGKTAANLIADPGRFRPRPTRREPTSVTAAVYAADALVLLIDASADDDEIDRLFHDFGRLLEKLEAARTTEREVGGLPVFLTLTKCDVLRRPGDDPKEWLVRVDARQRVIRSRFEDYLAEEEATGPLGFGSLDVYVAATALKFPDIPEFAALGAGPFGVEVLFHESTAAARGFRRRADRSVRQLRWTLAGAASLVGVMAAGLIALFTAPGQSGDPLADRVSAYRDRSGPPEVRLADRNFARNETELTLVRESASFNRLPADLREFVEEESHMFAVYRDYRDRFRAPRLGPSDVRSLAELDRVEAELFTVLVPPLEYAQTWTSTEAVRLWVKWKTDVESLRRAEETLYEWYRGLVRRATALELVPEVTAGWRNDVNGLLAAAGSPPFRPDAPVPGSPRVPVPRGATLTYAPAFQFDRIAHARQDWESEQARLLGLRDLTDALGMSGGPANPPAVLDLPEPTGDSTASRALPAARLRALREAYPSPSGDYREWVVTRFPDPLRKELRHRLSRALDTGARHVRSLIQAKFSPLPGSHAGWQPVADWVDADPPMKDWGQLLGLLRRLADNGNGDPVAELAAFLRRDRFPTEVRLVELTVPDDLRGQRAVPTGPLVVTVKPPDAPAIELRYRVEGEPRRDGAATVARFIPDGHDGRTTLRPSDDVSAVIPLRAGSQDFQLAWVGGGSGVFTFDRLRRQPEVRRSDGVGTTDRATGVNLVLLPEGGWPSVPPLFPETSPRQ